MEFVKHGGNCLWQSHLGFKRDLCFSTKIGWWFQLFLIFTPNLGGMIQFDEHIFSNGLVQPPTRKRLFQFHVYASLHFFFENFWRRSCPHVHAVKVVPQVPQKSTFKFFFLAWDPKNGRYNDNKTHTHTQQQAPLNINVPKALEILNKRYIETHFLFNKKLISNKNKPLLS